MKPEEIKYRQRVYVTGGFYQGCVGTVWGIEKAWEHETSAIKMNARVFLYTQGKTCLSRFFRVFRGFVESISSEDLEEI